MVRELHRQLISFKASQSFEDDRKLLIDVQRITRMLKNNAQDINAPTIWLTLEQKVTKPVLRQIKEAMDTEKFLSSFKDLVIAEEAIEGIYNQSHQRREIGKKPKMVERRHLKSSKRRYKQRWSKKPKLLQNLGLLGNKRRESKGQNAKTNRRQLLLAVSAAKIIGMYSKNQKLLVLQQIGAQQSVLSTTIWGEEAISSNGATCINPAVQQNRKGKQQQYKTNDIRDGHTCAAQTTAHKKGDSIQPGRVLVFFDSGSERSYVEKALASFLKMEAKNPAEITLTRFAGVDLGTYTIHMTKLCMKTAMGEVTAALVLICTDYFADFDIKTEKRLPSGFWVANSKVGRLIFGKGNLLSQKWQKKVTSTAISQEAMEVQLQNDDDGLNSMVKQFFDLEAAGMADAAHPTENEQWLDHFNKELHFNMEEKRYEELPQSAPQQSERQQRAPVRHEQRRAIRRAQRSRLRDDNSAPPQQKDQPRQKFNWAPVPPKAQHAASSPIMATTRPQPTKRWAPVDGVFHLSNLIYIPTLLHLLLAQILLEYSERWDAISNAIYTLTNSDLSRAELIQAAIAQKPLIGYGYTMGKKWTRGIPNPAKWQRMRARGSPQDLWWRFSDATTAVNIWNNHCRVAQAETEMAAQMEAAVEIAEEECPENHPASEKLHKMREDIQTTLQMLALEGKKIITSKFVVIAEVTTEALGYAINAFVTNCEASASFGSAHLEWAQHTATWLEYEDGFCSLAIGEKVQVATPQAGEVPCTWATKRYFVNDVKISAERMRELDEALEALILSQVPPPEERELKQNTFDAVGHILRRDTWEDFEMYIAGYTRSNTDLRNGDLDIVLMPKSGEPLSHERKLREIKFLVREFRLMKRQYPYRHCDPITKTKTPLVKIKTSEDVDIDITIDNSEAMRNSNYMAEQMNDSKLWRLYMDVKIFAEHNGIGDASCGGLNSLAWAVMTTNFAASRGQAPLLDFLQMAEYFSEFPFEGYTITTTVWRQRKSSSAPIYVEDPRNSEDNCARKRQAQDVCRVKNKLAHAWRQFIRKWDKCRLADLGFPCPRDEDFGWPNPRVQTSLQEEMDFGEKESDHSNFDPDGSSKCQKRGVKQRFWRETRLLHP
ncbi:hypothetical protein niasHT_036242 [Heterodera trifolii]|uniref:Poly(A) RNA polymerase mitochondrial-like central palm domain-containing protein n=1 Tax=Heterodera trifolii TaxID=157864 RepID=A0ABD2IG76_9BILA